jgi:hypothetical protein
VYTSVIPPAPVVIVVVVVVVVIVVIIIALIDLSHLLSYCRLRERRFIPPPKLTSALR